MLLTPLLWRKRALRFKWWFEMKKKWWWRIVDGCSKKKMEGECATARVKWSVPQAGWAI